MVKFKAILSQRYNTRVGSMLNIVPKTAPGGLIALDFPAEGGIPQLVSLTDFMQGSENYNPDPNAEAIVESSDQSSWSVKCATRNGEVYPGAALSVGLLGTAQIASVGHYVIGYALEQYTPDSYISPTDPAHPQYPPQMGVDGYPVNVDPADDPAFVFDLDNPEAGDPYMIDASGARMDTIVVKGRDVLKILRVQPYIK